LNSILSDVGYVRGIRKFDVRYFAEKMNSEEKRLNTKYTKGTKEEKIQALQELP